MKMEKHSEKMKSSGISINWQPKRPWAMLAHWPSANKGEHRAFFAQIPPWAKSDLGLAHCLHGSQFIGLLPRMHHPLLLPLLRNQFKAEKLIGASYVQEAMRKDWGRPARRSN